MLNKRDTEREKVRQIQKQRQEKKKTLSIPCAISGEFQRTCKRHDEIVKCERVRKDSVLDRANQRAESI